MQRYFFSLYFHIMLFWDRLLYLVLEMWAFDFPAALIGGGLVSGCTVSGCLL